MFGLMNGSYIREVGDRIWGILARSSWLDRYCQDRGSASRPLDWFREGQGRYPNGRAGRMDSGPAEREVIASITILRRLAQ